MTRRFVSLFFVLGLGIAASNASAFDTPPADDWPPDPTDVEPDPVVELACSDPVDGATPEQSRLLHYTLRRDPRRCASPDCGGYWVRRVNQETTVCANGTSREECYVAELDFEALGLAGELVVELSSTPETLLIQATRELRVTGLSGAELEVAVIAGAWRAATNAPGSGTFVRWTDEDLPLCDLEESHRCPNMGTTTLDCGDKTGIHQMILEDIHGLSYWQVEEGWRRALETPEGLLVVGDMRTGVPPFGDYYTEFTATQFYLPVGVPQPEPECVPWGCSLQICSDEPVMTTCEWLPEYACIRLQECERQPSGICGWTPTTDSEACFEGLDG